MVGCLTESVRRIFMKRPPLLVGAECLIPAGADAAQEWRIDDQFAEWVDQGHIDRREAANVLHVDAEMEPVPICRFDKGAQRCCVGGAVDQLEESLVLEAVHDAEESLEGPPGKAVWDCLPAVLRQHPPAVRNRGGTSGSNHISHTTTAHRSRGRSSLS